jgi:hypothetical protein
MSALAWQRLLASNALAGGAAGCGPGPPAQPQAADVAAVAAWAAIRLQARGATCDDNAAALASTRRSALQHAGDVNRQLEGAAAGAADLLAQLHAPPDPRDAGGVAASLACLAALQRSRALRGWCEQPGQATEAAGSWPPCQQQPGTSPRRDEGAAAAAGLAATNYVLATRDGRRSRAGRAAGGDGAGSSRRPAGAPSQHLQHLLAASRRLAAQAAALGAGAAGAPAAAPAAPAAAGCNA